MGAQAELHVYPSTGTAWALYVKMRCNNPTQPKQLSSLTFVSIHPYSAGSELSLGKRKTIVQVYKYGSCDSEEVDLRPSAYITVCIGHCLYIKNCLILGIIFFKREQYVGVFAIKTGLFCCSCLGQREPFSLETKMESICTPSGQMLPNFLIAFHPFVA